MQSSFRPYSDQANQDVIRELGSQIIKDVAPDEELTASKLIDRILQVSEDGDVLSVASSPNEPGSFGPVDLVTLVIIPLLVTTLGEICKQLVIASVKELTEPPRDLEAAKKLSQMIDVIVDEKYEEINKKVKSKKSKAKGKAIRSAVKIRIKNHLQL